MDSSDRVLVYDATLREGRQAPGVILDADGMARMAVSLDEFGVDVIEVGWPGANREWDLFFSRIASGEAPTLLNAQYAAFGSTHRAGMRPENDELFGRLVQAPVEIVTIFGKTWRLHVEEALRTTPDANLRMIEDSVHLLVKAGKRVFFDAEHLFQGVLRDGKAYAIEALSAAVAGGAEQLILCDTNGVAMPWDVEEIVGSVLNGFRRSVIGVHLHGDRGMSTANTVAAVRAGARHIQGTVNGYSERIRMACTIEISANLFLLIQEGRLDGIAMPKGYSPGYSKELSQMMHRLSGTIPNKRKPFVGRFSGTHKAGVHASAVSRRDDLYDSHDPMAFGVARVIVLSGMSGRSNVLAIVKDQWEINDVDDTTMAGIMSVVDRRESEGYRIDVCDGTAAVLIARQLWPYMETGWDHPLDEPVFNSGPNGTMATIMFEDSEPTAAIGKGPVDAMVHVVMKRYREKGVSLLEGIRLIRFGSSNIDRLGSDGSASRVRVEIEWKHPEYGRFMTQGVTMNQDMSAWQAIQEAFEFVFYKDWNTKRLLAEVRKE